MKIKWRSIQGRNCNHNSDYAAILNNKNSIILAIVDAKETNKSQEFAQELIEKIVNRLKNSDIFPDLDIFKVVNDDMRTTWIASKECASFIIFIVDKNNSELHIYSIGDCRLGYLDISEPNKDKYIWITQPHIIEGYPHFVFRSFRTRGEYYPPDYLITPIKNYQYILCTDGFWRDDDKDKDDRSYLLINDNNNLIDFDFISIQGNNYYYSNNKID